MSTTDERTQLVMRREAFEELRLHAAFPSATAAPERMAAVRTALSVIAEVDDGHVRVSCDALALEFIRTESPEIARLFPAVFGDVSVPRSNLMVSIAMHAIGQTVAGAQFDSDGGLRLEFESGAALIVSANGDLAWRHGG